MNEIKVAGIENMEITQWDFDGLKTQIQEVLEEYSHIVYTDDSIKSAKDDKAKMAKAKKIIEDKRKEYKKKCLAPYEEIEPKIKELVEMIEEHRKVIDSTVKDYEERQREEKKEKIRQYYDKKSDVLGSCADSLFSKILKDSWMNKITEIGAIRVVDGEIKEEAAFIFQELVHPYKKKIPIEVEKITGITNEMVKDARQMWEVFPDFADFIGDDILVGFNCMKFDSKVLVRAGRYSKRIITNPYFDVMRMALDMKGELGIEDSRTVSLSKLSSLLGIENSQAHRALADAVTTARVYLALLDKKTEEKEESLDDFLADLGI